MNKICTDIKQSKKLIELGIDMDTADMSYSFNFNSETYELSTVPYKDWIVPKYAKSDKFEQVIPAWSLNTLWGLMPNDDYHITLIYKTNRGWCSEYQEEPKSEAEGMHYEYPESLYSVYADTPLDVAFEMMCWLLDSRKL